MSTATYVNSKNNANKNLLVIRSDFNSVPIKKGSFDYVLGYGVMQHTKDPQASYKQAISFCSREGRCSFDHYIKPSRPSCWHHPKHFWRPLTSRLNPQILLKIIEFYLPKWRPIDTWLKRQGRLGNYFTALIPIPRFNFEGHSDIPQDKKYLDRLAILETFDALSATYDTPWTMKEMEEFARLLPVDQWSARLGGTGILLNTRGNTLELHSRL